MKNAVIVFSGHDTEVAERLDKSVSLMEKEGIISSHSSLDVLPGEDMVEKMHQLEAGSDVTIAVLSMDLDLDLLFKLIEEHESHKNCLLIVYANYVDEQLLKVLQQKKVPIFPFKPITEYQNKDAAYQKIVTSLRQHFDKKQPFASSGKKKSRSDLLFLIGARRKLPDD